MRPVESVFWAWSFVFWWMCFLVDVCFGGCVFSWMCVFVDVSRCMCLDLWVSRVMSALHACVESAGVHGQLLLDYYTVIQPCVFLHTQTSHQHTTQRSRRQRSSRCAS